MARPPKPAGELYGYIDPKKLTSRVDEGAKKEWSQAEAAILLDNHKDKTVNELAALLPNKSAMQIRRMLDDVHK